MNSLTPTPHARPRRALPSWVAPLLLVIGFLYLAIGSAFAQSNGNAGNSTPAAVPQMAPKDVPATKSLEQEDKMDKVSGYDAKEDLDALDINTAPAMYGNAPTGLGDGTVAEPLVVPFVMGTAVSENITPLNKAALATKPYVKQQVVSEAKTMVTKGLQSNGYYLQSLTETNPTKAAALLQQALMHTPFQQEIYVGLAAAYTQTGEAAKLKETCKGWYKLQKMSRLQLSYAYNVLQSVGPNGVLIVDDEPTMQGIWLAQEAEGIRPDVQVISLELARQNANYLLNEWQKLGLPSALDGQLQIRDNPGGLIVDGLPSALNDQLPAPYTPAFAEFVVQATAQNPKGLGVYYALTLNEPPAAVKDKLYLVGLAYAYSNQPFDNVALLRRHVEQDFRMDDLTLQWYETQTPANDATLKELAMRYTVPLVLLYQHYTLGNEPQKAMRLGQLITKLGNATGQTQNLLPLMSVPQNK